MLCNVHCNRYNLWLQFRNVDKLSTLTALLVERNKGQAHSLDFKLFKTPFYRPFDSWLSNNNNATSCVCIYRMSVQVAGLNLHTQCV